MSDLIKAILQDPILGFVVALWTGFLALLVVIFRRLESGEAVRPIARNVTLGLGLIAIAWTCVFIWQRLTTEHISIGALQIERSGYLSPLRSDLTQCEEHSTCKMALDYIALQRDIPRDRISIIGFRNTSRDHPPNRYVYEFSARPGWRICSVFVKAKAAEPASGPNATRFSFTSNGDKVRIETWSPTILGLDRAFYEGDVAIIFVKSILFKDASAGTPYEKFCTIERAHYRFDCAGHGLTPVEIAQIRRTSMATDRPPRLDVPEQYGRCGNAHF